MYVTVTFVFLMEWLRVLRRKYKIYRSITGQHRHDDFLVLGRAVSLKFFEEKMTKNGFLYTNDQWQLQFEFDLLGGLHLEIQYLYTAVSDTLTIIPQRLVNGIFFSALSWRQEWSSINVRIRLNPISDLQQKL